MNGRTWMMTWPGLAGLWLRGGWTNLCVAVAFAAAINFALVTTFLWPQLLSRDLPAWGVPLAAWVLVLWFWVMGRGRAVRLLALEAAKSLQPDDVSEALFCDAQGEYLKGHWLEAKSVLVRLLSRRPGDAEARLLLASVLRRSGELDLAAEQLLELSRLPTARRWQEEMEQEQRRLDLSKASKAGELVDQVRPETISRAA
jgi:hypothetical protein